MLWFLMTLIVVRYTILRSMDKYSTPRVIVRFIAVVCVLIVLGPVVGITLVVLINACWLYGLINKNKTKEDNNGKINSVS